MRQAEHLLQVACVRWFRYTYPQFKKNLFAVPNGGMRSKRTAALLKKEGTLAGVSDLILALPTKTHHALFIEMKVKGNYPSTAQKEFGQAMLEAGYLYQVCYTFEEFELLINAYIKATTHKLGAGMDKTATHE